jgi:hypothetical protein
MESYAASQWTKLLGLCVKLAWPDVEISILAQCQSFMQVFSFIFIILLIEDVAKTRTNRIAVFGERRGGNGYNGAHSKHWTLSKSRFGVS